MVAAAAYSHLSVKKKKGPTSQGSGFCSQNKLLYVNNTILAWCQHQRQLTILSIKGFIALVLVLSAVYTNLLLFDVYFFMFS